MSRVENPSATAPLRVLSRIYNNPLFATSGWNAPFRDPQRSFAGPHAMHVSELLGTPAAPLYFPIVTTSAHGNEHELEILSFEFNALLVSTVVLLYSHVLRFDKEIEYIWKKPMRPIFWIYALSSYPGLFFEMRCVCVTRNLPNCTAVDRLSVVSQSIGMAAVYVFQILRTYAICGKSSALLILLVVLAIPTFALQMLLDTEVTCTSAGQLAEWQANLKLVCDLTFESVVIAATVFGTLAQVKENTRLGISRRSLANTVLRNGLVYYALTFGLQLADIVTSILPITTTTMKLNLLANTVLFPLRWLLTCQFILELRERSEGVCGMSLNLSFSLSRVSTLTSFQTTAEAVRAVVQQDFGEPQVCPSVRLDSDTDADDGIEGRGT